MTSDRDVAVAILMELAQCDPPTFSLMAYYDDDIDFISAVQKRVPEVVGKPGWNKLTKVVRRLVKCGVLSRKMKGTQKYYIGEPTKQMEYTLDRKYCQRLAPDLYPHYRPMGPPDAEMSHILRHAYPDPELA